jgi:hypothetical protein
LVIALLCLAGCASGPVVTTAPSPMAAPGAQGTARPTTVKALVPPLPPGAQVVRSFDVLPPAVVTNTITLGWSLNGTNQQFIMLEGTTDFVNWQDVAQLALDQTNVTVVTTNVFMAFRACVFASEAH